MLLKMLANWRDIKILFNVDYNRESALIPLGSGLIGVNNLACASICITFE